MKTSFHRPCAHRPQRGSSMILALVAMAGLAVAGAAMMRSADTATLVAGSLGFQETATKATERAIETGIAKATALAATASDLNANSAANNYFASLETVNPEPTAARLSASTANEIVDTPTGNTLRYVVERMCANTGAPVATTCVMDRGTALMRVTALAVGPRFTSETTQVMFSLSLPKPSCGIETQTKLTTSGETHQFGNAANRCYHSNADLVMAGNVKTSGLTASAVGDASYANPDSSVTLQSGAPEKQLVEVNPAAHLPYATHVFGATGECSAAIQGSADGNRNCTDFPNGAWRWENSTQTWILSMNFDSTLPPAGLYHFAANLLILGRLGLPATPAVLSIVAARSIKIAGNMHLRDYTNAAHPVATNQVFIMAGGDLELPGGSTFMDATASSLMAAGAELSVNGSMTIEANLVARNEPAPAGSVDWASENNVFGQLRQTYNGNGASLTPVAGRQRWRVVRR